MFNTKKVRDPRLVTYPGRRQKLFIRQRKDVATFCKFITMLKVFTSVFLALALLAILQPAPSFAKKGKKGTVVKNVRVKTVCPGRKKVGQVLSIVSAVDLTLRFTHSKIGLLEMQAKHLKKANKMLLNRLVKMDRKLTGIARMIRKAVKNDKPKSLTICEGKKATLRCKKGKKINILEANYGRLNKRACKTGPIRTTNCKAAKSVALVRKTCHGKTKCGLSANNKVFGDPCGGTYKYLFVKYKCER